MLEVVIKNANWTLSLIDSYQKITLLGNWGFNGAYWVSVIRDGQPIMIMYHGWFCNLFFRKMISIVQCLLLFSQPQSSFYQFYLSVLPNMFCQLLTRVYHALYRANISWYFFVLRNYLRCNDQRIISAKINEITWVRGWFFRTLRITLHEVLRYLFLKNKHGSCTCARILVFVKNFFAKF